MPDLFLQKVLLHGDLDRIGLATVLGPNTALTIVCPVSLSRPVGKQGPQLSFCARETRWQESPEVSRKAFKDSGSG